MHHRLFYFSQSVGETAVFYSLSCKEPGFDRVEGERLRGPQADKSSAAPGELKRQEGQKQPVRTRGFLGNLIHFAYLQSFTEGDGLRN